MDEAWLASLPCDDGVSQDGMALAALLVSAPAGRVRLFVRPLYLEFKVEDVTLIQEIPVPQEIRPRSAIAVEVKLRPGAALEAIYSTEILPVSVMGGLVPFALATRPAPLMLPPSPRFKNKEEEYLRLHGIEAKS